MWVWFSNKRYDLISICIPIQRTIKSTLIRSCYSQIIENWTTTAFQYYTVSIILIKLFYHIRLTEARIHWFIYIYSVTLIFNENTAERNSLFFSSFNCVILTLHLRNRWDSHANALPQKQNNTITILTEMSQYYYE